MKVHHPDFRPDFTIRFRSSQPEGYNNNSSQFSVDPQFYMSGNVTGVPILSPTFRGACVVKNANQEITSGAAETLTWEVVKWDTDSWYSGGASTRLTVPAGVNLVRVSINVGWENNSSGWRQCNLWLNGSNATFIGAGEKREGGASNWSGSGFSSAVIRVNSGDYFEVRVNHSRGAANDVTPDENRSWFAVEVLG